MIKKSFTLRVLVISFLLLALPLLVYSFLFFQNSYYDAIKEAKANLREATNLRTFTLVSAQPVQQTLLSELVYLLDLPDEMGSLDQEKLSRQLEEIVHVGGEFQIYIMVLEKNNRYRIVASSVPLLNNTLFTSYQMLSNVMQGGKGTFIRYLYSRNQQKYAPYLFVARSIVSSDRRPKGIILVTSNVQRQLNAILDKENNLQNVQFALLNPDGVVFAASDPHLAGQSFDPLSVERQQQIIDSGQLGDVALASAPLPVIKGSDDPFFEFIYNDQVMIAYRTFVPEAQISIVGYSSKEAFFGTAVRHFLLIYSIYGLILIVGGGITYWISLLISKPLRQLSHVMGEVGRGNLGVRFKEEPLGFEINILGSIFNQTLDNLLQNIQHAEDERVKKETYQRELLIARQAQRSLIPQAMPKIKGAQVAGTYLPAREVGGDFYGYISKKTGEGEDAIVLSVADVSGSGISSCLYALSARSLFRTYSTLNDDVGTILSLANNDFVKDTGDTGMFVTIFMGMYHVESRIFSYFSCGHVPAIVRRANGQLVMLTRSGMALGLKKSDPYPTDSIQLYSGDMVILYTDGLLEAENEKHQLFSERRLKQVLQTGHWSSAQEAVNGIEASVQDFIGGVIQEEEVIIVALRVD